LAGDTVSSIKRVAKLGSQRVAHLGVTSSPTDAWVTQRLGEATPFSQRPCYLIRNRDRKYGGLLAKAASGAGIEDLRSPHGAPKANAICERFLGSVRQECLDHFLMLANDIFLA
jgi:putative transposase